LARPRAASAPLPAAMLFTIYTDPPKNRQKMLLAAAHGYAGIVVDALRIPVGDGVVLSAQLARPRAASAPLPAAMLFTIYTDPPKNRQKMLL
ncbi:hypothetical protein C7E17_24880, partial [Stenotrophomonas maltophilia]